MPRRAERCLQIAPHSLAIVLDAAVGGRPGGGGGGGAGPAAELGRHRIGYEIFADFKRENMQHFWDRRATAAVAETFFLGWIDEQVLLVQGKEEHLEVLRQGWARRSLKPPSGFHIKCLELSSFFILSCSPALSDMQCPMAGPHLCPTVVHLIPGRGNDPWDPSSNQKESNQPAAFHQTEGEITPRCAAEPRDESPLGCALECSMSQWPAGGLHSAAD
ncbi:storkhead-box protein 1-like isoform X2 [Heliangelus exortis]|uniref:storkhead-box protein 1-like isoform X2 n=1 Tax=Heliangelus exortis TaxID=472823 RepID=UPI003A939083